MQNSATAEIHNHGQPAALFVGGLLAGFGLICLAIVYLQGTTYTLQQQLTRERAEYQQQQITAQADQLTEMREQIETLRAWNEATRRRLEELER